MIDTQAFGVRRQSAAATALWIAGNPKAEAGWFQLAYQSGVADALPP